MHKASGGTYGVRRPAGIFSSLSNHADLRAAVLDGRLAPGVQLSVPTLARELAVSRGPVREAVLQLVADGLAQERPRRGVVVATLDYEQTQQIHRVREVLEGLAARMCAEETRPGLVESLRAVLAEHSAGSRALTLNRMPGAIRSFIDSWLRRAGTRY